MNRMTALAVSAIVATLLLCANAEAQHLWWDCEFQNDATCVYGEITVLATYPAIYYCGADWHPGEPAGGYCGIQDNSLTERRTIFAIWDTSDELQSVLIAANPRPDHPHFTTEGSGAHTSALWNWRTGATFQFFVQKQRRNDTDTTETWYYAYSPGQGKWVDLATISSPIGGKESVTTIGGGLNSFLENFGHKDKEVAKLALYRLWIGPSVDNLTCLTCAKGDGTWGELSDSYFLAEGAQPQLNAVFSALEKTYGKPVFGGKDSDLDPISDRPVPPATVKALESFPAVMEAVQAQEQRRREQAPPKAKAGAAAVGADASGIFADVEQFDLQDGAPGAIRKLSADFKPILVSSGANGGHALVGVARYGKGKAVITAYTGLGHQEDLVPGYLRWFNVSDGCTLWVLGSGSQQWSRLLGQYAGSVRLRHLDPKHSASWKPGDILWIEALHIGSGMSDEEIASVQEFVRSGGCLVTAALPWVWVAYDHMPADKVPDAWMNRLIRPFGAEYAAGYTNWPKGSPASIHDEDGKQVKDVIRR